MNAGIKSLEETMLTVKTKSYISYLKRMWRERQDYAKLFKEEIDQEEPKGLDKYFGPFKAIHRNKVEEYHEVRELITWAGHYAIFLESYPEETLQISIREFTRMCSYLSPEELAAQ